MGDPARREEARACWLCATHAAARSVTGAGVAVNEAVAVPVGRATGRWLKWT